MVAWMLTTAGWPGWPIAAGNDAAWLYCVVTSGVLAMGLPLLGSLIRLHRGRVRLLSALRTGLGESGTATIEFALVFPILLVLILLLAQVTLLMVGNLFVHYAASAATRAAIVRIPTQTALEPRNVIEPSSASSKFLAIRRAATTALVPVSGRLDAFSAGGSVAGVDPVGYADALRRHFVQGAGQPPGWVDTLAEEKMRYADANTEVSLLIYDEQVSGSFQAQIDAREYGPRDPVTVRVTHRLNLAVPYVRLFFADGEHTTVTGPGGYAIVEAQTTLTNQGVDTDLPDVPDRRRVP